MKETWKGHESGAETLENFFDWIKEFNIKETTFYAFSTENFNRSKIEKENLFRLFKIKFQETINNPKIYENKVRINFCGRLEMFDKELQSLMKELMEKTKKHNKFIVNFAMAYGGRQEIVDAVKKVVDSKEKINEENITKNLFIKEEPELIIRTGGSIRTSNFLPWQSVYSEWIFLDKLWPEFTRKDLVYCIDEFKKRKRNFGK